MLVKRGIPSCIIFSILTFGIYGIFWWVNLNNEFAMKNNKNADGWMVILLTIITCGIYGIIWNYKMGVEIEKAGGKNEGVLYLILSIVGLNIIGLCLMQIQANEICDLRAN